jgi:hypothetical protein
VNGAVNYSFRETTVSDRVQGTLDKFASYLLQQVEQFIATFK